MKSDIFILVFIMISVPGYSQDVPKVTSGSIKHIDNFKSQLIAARNVDVWLPDSYNVEKEYDVVYMHDGQMLFDSTQTWNKKEWKVDEIFSRLINEKKIRECIVVGIWNNGADRISEYFPNKIFNQLDEKTQIILSAKYCNGKPANGDNYIKFLVTELKPYIDRNFSTCTDRNHTFMIGSSMGGLISIYAICEYPEVFGGIASLSTAWLSQIEPKYEIPTATFEYLKRNMVLSAGHKIYMDYGTGESDKPYEATQLFVDLIVKDKGFSEDNYVSKIFENAEHNEAAWSRRLNIPIEFLIPNILP